jgi:hypothetical protein
MTYVLGRDTSGRWSCSCEAKGRCSHLIALAAGRRTHAREAMTPQARRELERLALREANTASALAARAAAGRAALVNGKWKH